MIKKLTLPTFLAMLALFLLACSPTTETAQPVEEVEAEPAAEVVEAEMEAEEEMDDDMEEDDHSEDEMAEEGDHDGEEGESHDMDAIDEDAKDGEESEMAEEDSSEEAMAESESIDSVYVVNVADSTVNWKGAKAVGNSHIGGINISEGMLTVADGELVSGSFVLDMTSITSGDNGGDRLIGHLKSDDFFGVETHPTATLVINSAESLGGGQYAVQGDLTIKNITNPIEFTATATETDGQLTASADIVFDRALYDVQYGSGSFFSDLGNDLINDEIEITVELVATK